MRPDPCRGFTLIEIMVALALASLTALAAMTLYRHSAQALFADENSAAQLARQDSQLIAALLGMQTHVQEAGFGIEAAQPGADLFSAPTQDDIAPDADGKLPLLTLASGNHNALFWRARPDLDRAQLQCRGLLFSRQAIYLLRPFSAGDCSAPGDVLPAKWNRIRWRATPLASGLPTSQSLRFSLAAGSCSPYNAGAVGNYQRVLLQLRDATQHLDRDFVSCLINFPAKT
nr:prepilin-type N-terminal cleavage/methylation domain-containing protein [Chromobacterium sp. ASV5]